MRAWLAYPLSLIVFAPQFPPGGTGQSRPPASPSRPSAGREQERAPQPRSRSATGDALDRYARGDYDAALSKLQVLGGFNVEQAALWVRAAGLDAVPKRRLVAATLVLDLADAKDAWPAQVVEWACESFREASSQPQLGEALWMRASVALAEREGIWTFLMPDVFGRPAVPAGAAWASTPVPPVIAHLAHGRARFPDDPHFKLAEATGAEVAASVPLDPRIVRTDQTPVAFDRLTAALEAPDQVSAPQREQLDRAAERLTLLLEDPVVGDEARVRLGYVELRRGRASQADVLLTRAETSGDAGVGYLARLFRGWLLAHEGRPDEAIAAYRAAVALVPGARSAAALLTASLIMRDRLDEAEAFSTAFMNAPAPDAADPWTDYLKGDGRSYAHLLRQLREAIK